MRRLVFVSIILFVCFAACTSDNRRNTDCEWPQEAPNSLDLRNPRQQQHLSDDALLAEDLAIRYADVHWGLRTGHYAGAEVYAQKRDACMEALFRTIAKNHDVTPEQVRMSLIRRRLSFDAVVVLSFAMFYLLAAGYVARRVSQRFPLRASRLTALAFTAVTSVGVSLIGALLGETWCFFAEGVRVGNQHLSYRAFRIPWAQHRLEFFLACLLSYWLAAAMSYRVPRGVKS